MTFLLYAVRCGTSFLCLSSLLFPAVLSAQLSPTLDEFPRDFKEQVFEHIEQLASFGIRSPETEAEEKTIGYLRNQFHDAGASVAIESFEFDYEKVAGEVNKKQSFNVVATISPQEEDKTEILITAHWDSYRGPGACDNASGVGVILELAKFFGKYKNGLPCNLRFLALGAEEIGLLGSKAYVKAHAQELDRCKFVINIDQVGGVDLPRFEHEISNKNSSRDNIWTSKYMRDEVILPLVEMIPPSQNIPQWLSIIITQIHYRTLLRGSQFPNVKGDGDLIPLIEKVI